MAKVDIEQLQKENEALRRKLAEQEESREQAVSGFTPSLQSEIRKIRQSQNKTTGSSQVIVKRSQDHINISLWDRAGNQIGPMHPDNAERFLNDMAANGVIFSVDKPTPAQVEAYKQTAEYKKAQAAEEKRRAIKNKSRKSGSMDKLISLMEKQYGVPASQMNAVLKPEEVKARG